jgi:hypothetical protein
MTAARHLALTRLDSHRIIGLNGFPLTRQKDSFNHGLLGEPLYGGLADERIDRRRARPCRVGVWGGADSIEGSRNLRDELVAQSWPSFVVPECGAAKLGLRLRM